MTNTMEWPREEILSAIQKATWRDAHLHPSGYDARAWNAQSEGWHLLVVSYTAEGEQRADGTAYKDSLIVHLPPDVAKIAVQCALESTT
jgi:hypothetical protein